MIVRELVLSNISAAFPREITVRFPSTAGVYAVAGPNGAGKTTLLEAMCPAALWRVWPSYGEPFASKVGLAAREGRVSLKFETCQGMHAIDVRHDVKGHGGRGKTAALYSTPQGSLGKYVTVGPGLAEVDAVRDKFFPSLATTLCSAFKAQRVNRPQGFFSLAPIDRKRLFVELLGLDYLQELSDAAARRAQDRLRRIEAHRTVIAQLALEAADAERLKGELTAASLVVSQSRTRLDRLALNLQAARDKHAQAAAEVATLEAEFSAAERRRVQIDEALRVLRARGSQLAERKGQLELIIERGTLLPGEEDPAESLKLLELDMLDAEQHRQELSRDQDDLITRLAKDEALKSKRQQLASRITDAEHLAEGLDALEDHSNPLCQRCPLTEKAREAKAQAEAWSLDLFNLPDPNLDLVGAQDRLRRDVTINTQLSATLKGRHAALSARVLNVTAAVQAGRDLAALKAEGATWQGDYDALRDEMERLPDGEPLVAARMRAKLLDGDVVIAARAVKVAEGDWGAAADNASRIEGALSRIFNAAEQLKAMEDEVAAHVEWLASEEFVARALGPNGVQALEIDDAGPDVSRIANELLAACYGPRFALELATTRRTKDGKGTREVFDVRFYDSQVNRWATQGSGGETVILDEALSLALAIVNREKSGHDLRTLWRDETAGALSPENSRAYLAMLRRARELGGFHQVYFVAHQEELWRGSDGFLWVEGGAVTGP